ncbi:MAG: hypothetical protein PQJ28_04175 [Spirochaetales bacterium]|nr:hypothetical protein [Spirochaetales bacterium]
MKTALVTGGNRGIGIEIEIIPFNCGRRQVMQLSAMDQVRAWTHRR